MGAIQKRIIITGGGTGGHVFPGIAVAKELLKNPEVEVLYVGKKNGPESQWVPEAGLAFQGIRASGFPRGFSTRLITFWPDFAAGFLEAGRALKNFRPNAIFSTGGYVSVPVSLAAALRGIPVGLLEPNVVPGLAAKFSALFSKAIFVGFEETMKSFSKRRTRWTGIPVREEIVQAEKEKAREAFGLHPRTRTLLLLGGSQGAHTLNRTLADVIRFLGQGGQDVQVIMMTGWNDYKKTVDLLENCPLKLVLRPFIANIHEAYAAADLAMARAGAMTCAELLVRGLPALLIPYPHASGHQERNARALETAGSAVVILEKDLEEEKLSQVLISLISDEGRLKAMGEAARKQAKPNAAKEIVKNLLEMAEKK